ncbi:MAG: 50S ribosomal protein L1 [Acidobacteriota bacterium]|nr:50S ribosomal protein L1 [Acidobacteriota bacterium]MDE2711286.1 50S ribosomal protein L1 [Acidobacteriota bacterium]MXW72467.1 50S ribosomal protein L1 [Acidobacteriota bacterium]MXX87382.1 50S ribosomal protein L1 [Acidobacteriota bacterium]MYE42964.1 50S ribosomal protein L1 [Acidobacteriota bacterium]
MGKKYQAAKTTVADSQPETLGEVFKTLKSASFASFDETAEIAMRLGVDPRHADQMVRGSVVLPHGLGISRRVVVIASGEKAKEAEDAGADEVGGDDMVARIQGGFLDFEAVVATPDMMRSVGKLGRILGPRGLMPNPKSGTVTFEVAKAVQEIKAGKVDYRVDKTSNIHAPVGKLSFSDERLVENTLAFVSAVVRSKPAAAKGRYIRSVAISSTMSPGLRISPSLVGAK